MYKRLLLLPLLALLPAPLFAQTPSPSPPDDDIVKITTTLIQIDVTVKDKKGNPVSDLRPDEVEIYENGEKQEITNFSFVSSKPQPSLPADAGTPVIPVPETRRSIDPKDVHRTIALVVDDLTLSFESVYYSRQALRNFVNNQMQDGDLVAIIRTGGGIGALQQFTTSKEQLLAAIEKIRWNMTGLGRAGAFAPILPANVADDQRYLAKETDSELERDYGGAEDLRGELFQFGTLGALSYIVSGMRGLPGRKSILVFSDGITLFRMNNAGFNQASQLLAQMRNLVDLCNRAAVVIYTMDARGLVVGSFTAGDNLGTSNPAEIEANLAQRRLRLFESRDGLVYLAKQTGGDAFYNTNDLKGSIGKMLSDQSYYLVGYEPADEVFNAEKRRFNKLEVKVLRKGVDVRYRSGFFGVDTRGDDKPLAGLKGNRKLLYALSSPFAMNDLKLDLHTVFKGASKKEMTVDAFLHIDVKDLAIVRDEKGERSAKFDVLIMNFGENGVPTGELSKTVQINYESANFDELLADGIVFTVTFPIKKPGPYQLRAAVRDTKTDKVGSASQFVLVPNVGKKRLTLSGIVVDDLTYETWNRDATNGGIRFKTENGPRPARDTGQFNDTALRRFKAGTVLAYAFEAYNVRAISTGGFHFRVRLIKDRKVIYTGNETAVDLESARDKNTVSVQGAINLAKGMEPGNYALQVVATDEGAKKKKYRTVSQFLQFEIVN